MAFPAFWDYVVISDPINCHKATSKRQTIGPFHLLSAPPLLRVFKKYPLDIALVIGYVDFSF